VLKDFSFHIQPGERIALVGSSGSGKSSIFQILLRFIEATRGEVRVNGIPLREIPREHWWGKLAYVSQKPYLFAGTILDNLHIGRRNASFEEIVECAKKAFAHEFIMSLPQGYDTVIGEGGARLSGGQAQRLALARAFLKGAPLLLLDEATSSLDIESEREVQVALEELIEDRTVIFAAHRLCTVENADRIVVLEQGQIVEQGSHEELMERQGLYTRFVREYWGRAK
jgi:ATP-binding cassette subfamily C protein CydD